MQFSGLNNSPFSTKNKAVHGLWYLPQRFTLWPGVRRQQNKTWKPPTWTEGNKGQWSSGAQSFHFYSATNYGVSISHWFWWHLTLWRQCLPILSHQNFSQVVPAKAMAAGPRQRGEEGKSSPGKHLIPCSALEHEDAYSRRLLVEKEQVDHEIWGR